MNRNLRSWSHFSTKDFCTVILAFFLLFGGMSFGTILHGKSIERIRYGDWVIIDYEKEGDAICSTYVASDHSSPSYVVLTQRGYIMRKSKYLELAVYLPQELFSSLQEEEENDVALQIGGDLFPLIHQAQPGQDQEPIMDGWFFLEDEGKHSIFMERISRGWKMSLQSSSFDEDNQHIYSLSGAEKALASVKSC